MLRALVLVNYSELDLSTWSWSGLGLAKFSAICPLVLRSITQRCCWHTLVIMETMPRLLVLGLGNSFKRPG